MEFEPVVATHRTLLTLIFHDRFRALECWLACQACRCQLSSLPSASKYSIQIFRRTVLVLCAPILLCIAYRWQTHGSICALEIICCDFILHVIDVIFRLAAACIWFPRWMTTTKTKTTTTTTAMEKSLQQRKRNESVFLGARKCLFSSTKHIENSKNKHRFQLGYCLSACFFLCLLSNSINWICAVFFVFSLLPFS